MLELLVLIFLVFITGHAFWKKGVVAGALLAVALVLHIASAFIRSGETGDSFPVSLILKGVGLVFLLIAVFKFYQKPRGGAPTATT
ncbi:MAG TPA: hypothetical protein VFX96_09935 [Pyrinomonadaceae bacterium]|nr:hypothetical protein [Pyrinomonadaceae bacterium]